MSRARRALPPLLAVLIVAAAFVQVAGAPSSIAATTCFGSPVTIQGTPSSDILTGTPARDVIDGGAGDDQIRGEGADDLICGGAGDDWIRGGIGNDELDGGDGFDVLGGEAGDDRLVGGSGADLADYRNDGLGPLVGDLGQGFVRGSGSDRLEAVEGISGSIQDDVLVGDAQANILIGERGSDQLLGGGSDDHLIAGSGRDTVDGGAGDDVMSGGAGDDVLRGGAGALDAVSYADSRDGVTANLAQGRTEGEGSDTIAGLEQVSGSLFRDVLIGDNASNVLDGKLGNDRLLGSGGDDFLGGANGRDEVNGGSGSDYCLVPGTARVCEATGVPSGAISTAQTVPAALTAPSYVRALGLAAGVSASYDTKKPECDTTRPYSTSIRPPSRVEAADGTGNAQTFAWWRPALFRWNPGRKRWVPFRQGRWARALIAGPFNPGRPIWGDVVRGAPDRPNPVIGRTERRIVRYRVPVAGRYAWKADVRWKPGSQRLFDWVEPHLQKRPRFVKACRFG